MQMMTMHMLRHALRCVLQACWLGMQRRQPCSHSIGMPRRRLRTSARGRPLWADLCTMQHADHPSVFRQGKGETLLYGFPLQLPRKRLQPCCLIFGTLLDLRTAAATTARSSRTSQALWIGSLPHPRFAANQRTRLCARVCGIAAVRNNNS